MIYRNYLTNEEIDELVKNKYVKRVSRASVSYTEEFKKLFWEQRKEGKGAREIFISCGLDPTILGEKRIEGFSYEITKRAETGQGFEDRRKYNHRSPATDIDKQSDNARIRKLEHELAYTRQEVEFLKKLQMADMEARRKWESKHRPE